MEQNIDGDRFIDNALAGLSILPANPPFAEKTKEIFDNVLQFDPDAFFYETDQEETNEIYWEPVVEFMPADVSEDPADLIDDTIISPNPARQQVLLALGLLSESEDESSLIRIAEDDGSFSAQFLILPQIQSENHAE